MNIFYLDEDPKIAAEYMYKKHVVKMILESAQLLSTVHHVVGAIHGDVTDHVPYKKTHMNHPSTIWARESVENYNWLYDHFIALCERYTQIYGKIHLSQKKCAGVLKTPPKHILSKGLTRMPQAMDDHFRIPGDSVAAYRNYYIKGKDHIRAKDEPRVIFN